jgi:hypothetical protein
LPPASRRQKTLNWFPENSIGSTLFLRIGLPTSQWSSPGSLSLETPIDSLQYGFYAILKPLQHNLDCTESWQLLPILLFRNVPFDLRQLDGTFEIAPVSCHAALRTPIRRIDSRYLTLCVIYRVAPFNLHLNIGFSPILQSSGESAFFVSFLLL